MLPISSDLSQVSFLLRHVPLKDVQLRAHVTTSYSYDFSCIHAGICWICWMIPSHCPGLLVEGTSVFSLELPLVWKARTDSVKCSDQMSSDHFAISMLQSFLHLLHKEILLWRFSHATGAALPASRCGGEAP